MIVDERTYHLRPGTLAPYLAHHRAHALPLMRQHLGEPLAYFTGLDGEPDVFVHLWIYADAADRERRRAALYADPRWLAYREDTGRQGWVVRQHNRLLRLQADAGQVWAALRPAVSAGAPWTPPAAPSAGCGPAGQP